MAVDSAPVATPVAPVSSYPAPSAPAPSTIYLAPQNPATSMQNDVPMPAMRALPANITTSGDVSTIRKFYTLTASLRQTYDTNVNTSSSNSQGSLETTLSPSVLVDFPGKDGNGGFSGRYSLNLTYYTTAPSSSGNGSSSNNSGGNNQGSLLVNHDFSAQYNHSFSERYQLGLSDSVGYYTEPSILQSVGTNYQNGNYISNTFNGSLSCQWTPLYNSSFSYANNIVRYDNSTVALEQNSFENTGSSSFGYALLPKISVSFGGVVDVTSYEYSDRGYNSYTGFGGVSWEALPTLSISARAGGSYTQTGQAQGQSSNQSLSSLSPYAALSGSWTLGARSSLSFSYEHEITPSDQANQNDQESDRFDASFGYAITTRLSSSFDGVFTSATSSNGVSGSSNYRENSYSLETGFSYQYDSNFGFDTTLSFSGVASNVDNNNYGRAEVSVGVRGTY